VVLEKHADFLRDFRGDTIHASTLNLMDELGWGEEFLGLPHQKARQLSGVFGDREYTFGDCRRLPGRHRYIALMPQWDFLDFLAGKAESYDGFTLLRSTEVDGLLRGSSGRVAGVSAAGADGRVEVRARLVVACDGRHSDVRRLLGLEPRAYGVPMDVLWFRLPRQPSDPSGVTFIVGAGLGLVLIDRGDYFQVAYVIRKGGFEEVRAGGLDALVANVARLAPSLAGCGDVLKSWDDVRRLTVVVNRLRRWDRDGVLLIGDAAHAMSPMGGVGVNLAVQDAVAAARLLAPGLDKPLWRVQLRRWYPTVATQLLQRALGRGVVARVLSSDKPLPVPGFVKLADRFAVLQGLPARAVAIGFLPEHIATPSTGWRNRRPNPM
jgi:2-polyprenyl-6-methoxyphenol hydroxylase-like FAD-dependent oxidoreductase